MSRSGHVLKVVGRSARIVWTRSPLAGQRAAVRREIKVQLVEGQRRLVRTLRVPLSAGRAAEVEFAAVLDGNTLNLRAPLPETANGATSAELLLQSGAVRHTVPAELCADGRGGLAVEATVLLGEAVGGVAVRPGRWSLSVELQAGSGPSLLLPLIGRGHAYAAKGPAGSFAVCRRTGIRYRAGVGPTGQLQLTVAAARPSAELARVRSALGALGIDFQLLAVPAGASGPVRLELAADGIDLKIPCEPIEGSEGLWHAQVPLKDVFTASTGNRTWEFRIVDGAGQRLPLRRRAHDLYNPGPLKALPRTSGIAGTGVVWHARPRYDRNMTLQLQVYPAQGITTTVTSTRSHL